MKLKVRKKVKKPKKFKMVRKVKADSIPDEIKETPPTDVPKQEKVPPKKEPAKKPVEKKEPDPKKLSKNTNEFPMLYAMSSQKKMMFWEIMVVGNATTLSYGHVGGKPVKQTSVVEKGKNIGKSNETTPAEQALAEAHSTYRKKLDEGYISDMEEAKTKVILLPMLALNYHERKHDIVFGAFAQPKLNGVRCLCKRVKNILYYISKKGKAFTTLQHLDGEMLSTMHDGEILDGEIYTTEFSFQKIVSALKKLGPNTPRLQFHCYDVVSDDDFEKRLERVKQIEGTMLKSVPTYKVENDKEIVDLHRTFVLAGHEGLMVRNKKGGYTLNYRTADLQKFKVFEDKEFPIVGGEEGSGLDKGCVIFICTNEEGLEFKCRPKGTKTERRKWLKEIETFKGKNLTVKFAARTDDNLPVHGVGIAVRDYE